MFAISNTQTFEDEERIMKPRTLIALTLAISLVVPVASVCLAADSTDRPASEKVSIPLVSNMVLQFERMSDPRTQQRLYYRVHEVASQAGITKDDVLASIRDRGLCVIRVEGVPLIPANFAQGYVEYMKKAASVAADAGEQHARND